MGTQYLAVMASYLVHPLVTLSATSISNLVDGSGLVSCTVQYAVTGDSGILAGAQLSYGETLTEYWYYPPSLNLQFDVYF